MAIPPTHDGYPLWLYYPNLGAAIAFSAMFAILTIAHTYMMFRHRMWFCAPMVVGGLFEVVGYIGRAIARNSTDSLGPYIMQSTLLLLAPIFFAASLYMTLSRVIVSVNGQQHSPIPPRWLTRFFVFCDCFSFLMQASGAGLLVQGASGSGAGNAQTGQNVILGGLIFQIVMFGVYVAVTFSFHRRFGSPRDGGGSDNGHFSDIPWRTTIYMLYATSVFIILRNVFRAVEYGMGHDGYLLSTEWGVYVFDGALMLLTMLAFLLRYPSQLSARKQG